MRLKRKQDRLNQTEDMMSPEKSPEKGEDALETEDSKLPILRNIWILKPGENTNCGNGIQVAKDYNEIIEIIT